jgi:dipeptidyl aminopeptidase/acylaminoacyl peptidase
VEESKPHIEVIWSIPINPATGAATGPAQRVSLGSGGTPSFSPDGKSIAFVPYAEPSGDEVAVAPATGGAQRTLAKYKDGGISWTSWSDDGKWIVFVHSEGPTRWAERVPVGGGPSEKLISFPGNVKGLVDGLIAFYYPDRTAALDGRLAYRTASGPSGEISVPSFAGVSGGTITAKFATPLWLWAKGTQPAEGPPTSTIYELDMTPVLQSVVKR